MPSIFHREAYEAAAGQVPGVASFETWEQLAEALEKLTPEQRCDAVNADWLLQLHSPAHQALLQIRNLLIGQGALAANYLAELAQNADDAADGKDAEVRIVLDGDWLFVANNGRKVTSMNLLGLSRFFVHAAGKVRELNAETIGRFGIGFKSSYRIASEVLVHTWEGDDAFAFRLPICRESESASHPNQERLNYLRSRLTAVGIDGLENAFRDVNSLGYCTPEFVSALPSDLSERTAVLRQPKQGTLFCFHLRSDQRAEVERRISGQAHEVYELCPLFLPNLSLVQFGPNTLRMVASRAQTADLPSAVEADKVTLTTSAPSQSQSHSRFWRLRGVAPGDLWQVALHADSQHRLRLNLEDDEQGVTLKEGSAYAFFPLNGMNQTWPFRLHLHCKLPTKLERDNWNPTDAADVEDQLRRAVRGMVAWLETQADTLAHGEWGFERLLNQRPAPPMNEGDWPAKWANVIFGEMLKAVEERPLLRSVFGRRVLKAEAQRIEVVENHAAREAWSQLASAKDLSGALPAFVPAGTAVFGVASARPDEIGEPFAAILGNPTVSAATRRAAMLAYLSTSSHSTSSLERAFEGALVERADSNPARLSDLMAEPCGTELSPEWHSCFARLTEWGRDAVWQSAHVFNGRLPEQFRKLSKSVFNPSWAELRTRLGSLEAWQTHGKQLWENDRRPCPPQLLASALDCLHVPSGDGRWLLLSKLWLDDDTPVDCFAGLLTAWPLRYADNERKRITGLLKEWGLFAEWEKTAQKALAEKLPGELARRLTEQSGGDAFGVVFDQAFQDARRLLDGGWAHVVNEAEKTAVSRFIQARAKEDNLSGKTVLSASIVATIRAALCLDAEFVLAPPWLTDAAHQRICRLGLEEKLGLEFITQQEFIKLRERLGRELLERFHLWQIDPLSEVQLKGVDELCSPTSLKQRREWQVGLGPNKPRRLRDLILAGVVQIQMTDLDKLRQKLLDKADWRGEPLPPVLAKVRALAEACIQPTKLDLETKLGTLTPLDREQLAPETLSLPEVSRLLATDACKLYGSPQPLNIKWRYDGEVVATLDNAEFIVEADHLIVHQFRPPADEKQCHRILSQFETYAVEGADYKADAALPPYERYQKHRDAIRRTLLKELVSKVGYEKHHILRELLQNAESAYASKRDKPTEAWFEFLIEAAGSAGRRKVSARHAGRAFNEPDSAGHERHDVERIWRLAAESERTADEVGRFNRGFKTVFSVATNGSVRIRSGDFDFEVIDLLMLKPAEPKPNPAKHSPLTEFLFEAEFGHALEMFRLDATPGLAAALPILNPTSFVFLGYLQRVTVKFEQRVWQWRIVRREDGNSWSRIAISSEGLPQSETFLVFAGAGAKLKPDAPDRRFAAAVRLGPSGLPMSLDKAWRKFRLTFETEHDFPLDFLVNGDFEADQGRVALRHIARSGLVELAYDAVLQRAQQEIRETRAKDVWLAWARVLHLKEAATELEASSELRSLRSKANKTAEFFASSVPHAGDLVPVNSLIFPTVLFRRLATLFGTNWVIDSARWIDSEVAVALPDNEQRKHSFHTWLNDLPPEAPILRVVEGDLKSEKFARLRFSAPEQDELKEAKQVLAEKLRPVIPPRPPDIVVPVVEPWTVANLWHWWERQGKPAADYTIEGGENWQLFYADDPGDTHRRRERLKQDLLASTTDSGKRVWYRLFGLACLMSAGRRMTELRGFWQGELDTRQFWESTSGTAFGLGTDALFDDLMQRRFANLIASGEHAYFWRRIFYDLRKIHKLVWEDGFPDTLLRLTQAGRGGELLNFLKTGTLSGQQSWVGVFGQSAGAPLFFLVRELCRLGAITDAKVLPLAFFVSTPVRRALERIGWPAADSSERPDFESLSSISAQLHAKISGDREFGPKLLPYYDIPLLHLGLNG
jgi:hypothetical protein